MKTYFTGEGKKNCIVHKGDLTVLNKNLLFLSERTGKTIRLKFELEKPELIAIGEAILVFRGYEFVRITKKGKKEFQLVEWYFPLICDINKRLEKLCLS